MVFAVSIFFILVAWTAIQFLTAALIGYFDEDAFQRLGSGHRPLRNETAATFALFWWILWCVGFMVLGVGLGRRLFRRWRDRKAEKERMKALIESKKKTRQEEARKSAAFKERRKRKLGMK